MWPWPLTSKINRVHPLIMVSMSAKFDKEIHNSLVCIVFTSLFLYTSIVALTFELWPPKSIGFILSPWLTCPPSLIKNMHWCSIYRVHKVQARSDGRMHGRTKPQQRYYIPTATRFFHTWRYPLPVNRGLPKYGLAPRIIRPSRSETRGTPNCSKYGKFVEVCTSQEYLLSITYTNWLLLQNSAECLKRVILNALNCQKLRRNHCLLNLLCDIWDLYFFCTEKRNHWECRFHFRPNNVKDVI